MNGEVQAPRPVEVVEDKASPTSNGHEPPKEDVGTAAQAFASALAAAGRRPTPAGDPLVSVAFALGWQMAELYGPANWPADAPTPQLELPGLAEFSGRQHAQMGLNQVDVALSRLQQAVTEHGLVAPTTTAARKVLEDKGTNDEFRKEVFELHVMLLSVLTAASFRLGKAYGLGRALADTTTQPTDVSGVKAKLAAYRIANLVAWINDLTSLFPPHAAHSVAESLIAWREWAKTPAGNPAPTDAPVIRLLRRQGQRWRALLSGEKQATDGLKLENYVSAGSEMLKRLAALTRQFLAGFWVATAMVATLFVASIAFILVEPDSSAHVAAGIGGVLASVGLTWKGMGASLGKAAANLERPVWEASLDVQITDAITLVPGSKPTKGYTPPLLAGEAEPDEGG